VKLRADAALGGQGAAPVARGGGVGTSGEATGERSDSWKDKIRGEERIQRYALCLCPMPFLHYVLCDMLDYE
jgi:hypothetical protein